MRKRPVRPRLYECICGITFFEKEKRFNKIINRYSIKKNVIKLLSQIDNKSYILIDSLIINDDIKDPSKFLDNRQSFLDKKSFT